MKMHRAMVKTTISPDYSGPKSLAHYVYGVSHNDIIRNARAAMGDGVVHMSITFDEPVEVAILSLSGMEFMTPRLRDIHEMAFMTEKFARHA